MERIALVAGTRNGRIDETEVEMGVVADQDRALAAVLLHRGTHRDEDVVQCRFLFLGQPDRVVEDDAGHFQRLRIDLQALGRHHGCAGGLAGVEQAGLVHLDRHGGDFQQRIALAVETAGFHIDHHRQEAAEAL
ncbi:hypothetical protein G6F31_011356 [Rhizopus arrhizus]|nr:hypothetical protein G6F31_011356 [Rhizopus arrhizus]